METKVFIEANTAQESFDTWPNWSFQRCVWSD